MFKILRPLLLTGICGAALLTVTAQTPAFADEASVIATVNGTPVTEAEISLAEQQLGQQFARLSNDQKRAAALTALIEIKLLAKKAEDDGLDKTDEFKQQMEFLRERALHSAEVDAIISNAVTDEDVRARYDKQIADTPPESEIHARHILVKTEKEARDIIKQLDEGADFQKLAVEHSTGPSGPKGGDLGYFSKGQMVPAFENAAFALDVGQYTKDPVQTQFGWHVIEVEDKRAKQPAAFDEVKDQIRNTLMREAYVEAVGKMRDAATIEINDPEIKKIFDRDNEAAKAKDKAQ
jgi:peptidyl-prolyl cis-trans isomerase C